MSFDDQYTYENYSDENVGNENYESQPAAYAATEAKYPPISQKIEGVANIVVVGVGGGGCNAVNGMVKDGVDSATFAVMNTDKMALDASPLPPQCKIQLGEKLTRGLGAGSIPEIGKKAAEESRERIKAALQGIDLLFITVGMGGGTGTGAAPVVASIARDMNILTVAVVTKPFNFEGKKRIRNAEQGIAELRNYVDTLLIIPNQRLIDKLPPNAPMPVAFAQADNILRQGVIGVSNLITKPGYINVDFADVKTVLTKSGLAHIGVGSGDGENRVYDAIRAAATNPLIETDLVGATGLIINFVGGDDLTLGEVDECSQLIQSVLDPEANIVFGSTTEPNKHDVTITIIATGFKNEKVNSQKVMEAQHTQPQRPLSQTLAAADVVRKEQPASVQPLSVLPSYPVRPVFGESSRPAAQPYQQSQPAAPAQPAPQYGSENRQSGGVGSSRMDVPQHSVPHFLRRLRESRNGKEE